MLLSGAAHGMGDSRVPAILRMVLAERRTFPDLACIWHDEVAARIMDCSRGSSPRRRRMARRDPKLDAFSIMGPMAIALLFREVFGRDSPYAPDLDALAARHAETVLKGIAMP